MLKILNSNIQDFISANLRVDLHSLLLKKSPFDDVSIFNARNCSTNKWEKNC